MIDAKTHISHLRDQLQSGTLRPSVLKEMTKVAQKRGDHEFARRAIEAARQHDVAVGSGQKKLSTAKPRSAVEKLAAASQTGPHGGRYHIGPSGEKVYEK